MSNGKVIANIVGLAGCAAVVWGLHGLILNGSCGGPGLPACPPEMTPLVIAVGLGMAVSIISAVAGGRMAFLGLFLAVGVGALWAGFEMPADQRTFPFVFGGLFAAVAVVPLMFLPFVIRKKRQAMRLLAEGGTAIGTVTGIRDTGVTVNGNPRVALTLLIEPQDRSTPFEGTKTITASRVDLPYRGQRFPIWFDRDDHSVFALGTQVDESASPEVRRLFALAEAGNPARPGSGDQADSGQASTDPLDRLAKLHELKLSGALTDYEYELQKAKLLDSQ